jgi:hypothetical protein
LKSSFNSMPEDNTIVRRIAIHSAQAYGVGRVHDGACISVSAYSRNISYLVWQSFSIAVFQLINGLRHWAEGSNKLTLQHIIWHTQWHWKPCQGHFYLAVVMICLQLSGVQERSDHPCKPCQACNHNEGACDQNLQPQAKCRFDQKQH